jgi:hypothetical protein
MLIKSNESGEPLHLTYAALLHAVANRQGVKSVVDALNSGGKNLQEIINCDGVRP